MRAYLVRFLLVSMINLIYVPLFMMLSCTSALEDSSETPEYLAGVYIVKPHFNHLCLTHNDNPLVVQAIDWWAHWIPIRDCGVTTPEPPCDCQDQGWNGNGQDIRLEFGNIGDSADLGVAIPNYSWDSKYITGCFILIDPVFSHSVVTAAHELGHCLGLGHFHDENSLMSAHPAWFSALDIAAARAMYGTRDLSSRISIPQAAQDPQ